MGPFVRNKANFNGDGIEGKPFAERELCRMCLLSRFGKTKPIPATMPIRRSAFPGASVRNKANSLRAARKTSALWTEIYGTFGLQKASAKQSQFRVRAGLDTGRQGYRCRRGIGCTNKANCHHYADQEIGVPRGRACKTKPISGGAALALGSNVRNKTRPTKVGISRADPRYSLRNADRRPIRGLLSWASNKANLPPLCRSGDRRSRGAGRAKQSQFPAAVALALGSNVRNKANLPPLCRSGDRRSRGASVRNKANSGSLSQCRGRLL